MTPRICRVSHNPPETYGDCVSACIGTIMDREAPHFVHDNCDAETMFQRIRDWLKPLGYSSFWTFYPGEPLETVLGWIGERNPDSVYMLIGETDAGQHAVVCQGSEVVHNPGWVRHTIRRPIDGVWFVLVIGKI